jgi:hypothetical protein
MSDQNNLDGPPPTAEERAAMARELDKVAPTPAEKFRLMLGQQPTPRMDAAFRECGKTPRMNWQASQCYNEGCKLERELAEAREEGEEQARLLGMSGEREAGLLAEIDRLKRELAEAREEIDEWFAVHNEMVEQRNLLAEALRACLPIIGKPGCPAEWILADDDMLDKAWRNGQSALAALKGGTDE